jgi:putative ABC transport system permease protein
MLEIRNLVKEYHTGDTVQRALDGISLNLRDNEFVAILGASGSGKTTLLNMIGGLDRYDGGDLLINGISTKDFQDRDWDAYRNHTVGFVFQSYNLIAHQSVLSNVELALTISGISGAERKKRAMEALEKVGLSEHINKKPNQLSGGQMQRVAIARALVNDPDILLADEPTGALDSTTSLQVMELLKQVARDRLVVMVTHNPKLAEQYATRIVRIRDGKIEGDTDPFVAEEEKEGADQETLPLKREIRTKKADKRAFRHTSMSFLTALSLSFNNLKTKKARTFMVSFAGSIGIIGIALVLALSTGVSGYVRSTEEAALTSYPLEISRAGVDLTSLITENSGSMFGRAKKKDIRVNDVGVDEMADRFLSGVNNNDLKDLKKYFDSGTSGIEKYVTAVEYSYDVTPQIYRQDETGTYQLNPNKMLSSMMSSVVDVSSLMSGVFGQTLFHAMPENSALYEDLYDVKAGRWPENDNEVILVLSAKGEVTDVMLYELGIRDPKELENMIQGFSLNGSSRSIKSIAEDTLGGNAEAVMGTSETSSAAEAAAGASEVSSASGESGTEGVHVTSSVSGSSVDEQDTYPYETFLGQKFKLVQSADYYTKDEQYGVWTDHSDNEDYVKDLVSRGEDMTIVGIVQPKNGENAMALQQGLNYPHSLVTRCMDQAKNSEAVKEQLQNPDRNIFTGKPFGEDDGDALDFSKMITLDHDAVAKAFSIDTSALDASDLAGEMENKIGSGVESALPDFSKMNLGDLIDVNALADALPDLSQEKIAELAGNVKINATADDMKSLFEKLASGYLEYAAGDPSTNYNALPDAFQSYLQSDEAGQILKEQITKIVNRYLNDQISEDAVRQVLTEVTQSYIDWSAQQEDGQSSVYNPENLKNFLASDAGNQAVQSVLSLFQPKGTPAPTNDEIRELASALLDGYDTYAGENQMPQLSKLTESFASYLGSDGAQKLLLNSVSSMIDTSSLESAIAEEMKSAMTAVGNELSGQIASAADGVISQVTERIEQVLISAMNEIVSSANQNMGNFFKIDENAFGRAIRMNMSAGEIQELLTSILTGEDDSYDGNLAALGYADRDNPSAIDIYSKDFQSKSGVTGILDDYNEKMRDEGHEDRVITYSDMVGAMMQSITRMIQTVSYVLIAFIGISLVVSSIMIGVITYISVLERRKEIGILRALGASKRNVAQVFNAETFITGAFAGMLGVGITLSLIPLVNYIILRVTGESVHAMLEPLTALLLVGLSIGLTLLAGLIPAGKAAKSDPVEALRTE